MSTDKQIVRPETAPRILLPLVLILLTLTGQLFSGAWTQKKGKYFSKFSWNYFSTGQEFNHLGKRQNILQDYEVYVNTSFQDMSFESYLEYGLVDWFTVVTKLAYKVSTSERTETGVSYFVSRRVKIRTAGFADWTLLGRLRLLENPVVFSLQGGVKVPTGYQRLPENDGPALGTAETDGEIAALLGKSLYPLPFYLTGGGGYRSRGGPLHDEWFYNFEIGYATANLIVKLYFDGVLNTETPPDIYGRLIVTPIAGGGGAFPDLLYGDQDYHKVTPGVIYRFRDSWAVQLEAIYIYAGKNIVSGTTWSVGLVRSIR